MQIPAWSSSSRTVLPSGLISSEWAPFREHRTIAWRVTDAEDAVSASIGFAAAQRCIAAIQFYSPVTGIAHAMQDPTNPGREISRRLTPLNRDEQTRVFAEYQKQ